MARKGIEERSATAAEPCEDTNKLPGLTQIVVDVPSVLTESEDSNSENDDNGDFYMEVVKKDLPNSFSQFEKSIEKRGLDLSKLNSNSHYWNPEGMGVETHAELSDSRIFRKRMDLRT